MAAEGPGLGPLSEMRATLASIAHGELSPHSIKGATEAQRFRRDGASHIKTADFVGHIDIHAVLNLLLALCHFLLLQV